MQRRQDWPVSYSNVITNGKSRRKLLELDSKKTLWPLSETGFQYPLFKRVNGFLKYFSAMTIVSAICLHALNILP